MQQAGNLLRDFFPDRHDLGQWPIERRRPELFGGLRIDQLHIHTQPFAGPIRVTFQQKSCMQFLTDGTHVRGRIGEIRSRAARDHGQILKTGESIANQLGHALCKQNTCFVAARRAQRQHSQGLGAGISTRCFNIVSSDRGPIAVEVKDILRFHVARPPHEDGGADGQQQKHQRCNGTPSQSRPHTRLHRLPRGRLRLCYCDNRGDEAITPAGNGFDERRVFGGIAQGVAHFPHERIQAGFEIDDDFGRPQGGDDFFAWHQATVAADQKNQ